jgi:hypothetical protein
MRVEYLTVLLLELQGRSDISVAAVLEVGLEEQALDLAAFGLLERLDLVERELEGTGGSQPGLKLRELDISRGVSRERSCSRHILTVI